MVAVGCNWKLLPLLGITLFVGLMGRGEASAEELQSGRAAPLTRSTEPQLPGAGVPVVAAYWGTGHANLDAAVDAGVNALFVSVSWYQPNEFVPKLIERFHQRGLKVFLSLATAYDGYEDKHHEFAAAHPELWEKRRNGDRLDKGVQVNLTWGAPEVRAYKVQRIRELVARSGCDGILLDYTRYFGNDSGYHDILLTEFRRRHRLDARQLAPDDPAWVRFRAEYVNQFVRDLRRELREAAPKVQVFACVHADPGESLQRSLQDWSTWVQEGLVDGVVTMIYTRDTNHLLHEVQIANRAIGGRVPHIPMIAPYRGNLTTPGLLREGAHKCLKAGVAGIAIYREDSIVEHGLWETIGEIARWDPASLGPVNYVQNCGFELGFERWAVGDGAGVSLVTGDANEAGPQALQLQLEQQGSVRQLITEGFFPDRRSVRLKATIEGNGVIREGLLSFDLTVNAGRGNEASFRVPVTLPVKGERQTVDALLPLENSTDINFLLLAIEARQGAGSVIVDDVSLTLEEQPAGESPFAVTAAQLATGPRPGVNLARGQITQSSSFFRIGYEPENAVDGELAKGQSDEGTAWYSQRPAKDQWLKVFLPAPARVTRIRLLNPAYQSAYRTRDFQIDVSLDHHRWRTVARGRMPDDGTSWVELQIPPTPARYVRFTGLLGYNVAYAVGLQEIEIYAE